MERNGAVLRRGFGLLCKLMKTEKFFFFSVIIRFGPERKKKVASSRPEIFLFFFLLSVFDEQSNLSKIYIKDKRGEKKTKEGEREERESTRINLICLLLHNKLSSLQIFIRENRE